MNCEQIRELMSEHIDGVLDGDRSRDLIGHMAECGDCRRELEALTKTVSALRDLDALEPPADLLEGIHERLSLESTFGPQPPSRIAHLFSLPWLRASAAAILLVGVICIWGLHEQGTVCERGDVHVAEATRRQNMDNYDGATLAAEADAAYPPTGSKGADRHYTRKKKEILEEGHEHDENVIAGKGSKSPVSPVAKPGTSDPMNAESGVADVVPGPKPGPVGPPGVEQPDERKDAPRHPLHQDGTMLADAEHDAIFKEASDAELGQEYKTAEQAAGEREETGPAVDAKNQLKPGSEVRKATPPNKTKEQPVEILLASADHEAALRAIAGVLPVSDQKRKLETEFALAREVTKKEAPTKKRYDVVSRTDNKTVVSVSIPATSYAELMKKLRAVGDVSVDQKYDQAATDTETRAKKQQRLPHEAASRQVQAEPREVQVRITIVTPKKK